MNTFTIKTRTTLTDIKAQVYADFRVEIDNATARQIRDAHKTGTLVWTDKHLITTDASALNFRA